MKPNEHVTAEEVDMGPQMLHLQKLEMLGQVAAGVAHDMNSLLAVISGYGQMALESTGQSHPLYTVIREMLKATERGTSLTRQVLDFGRKEVRHVRPVDLNELVTKSAGFVRRLIPRSMELNMTLDPSVGPIQADPSEMEQVILNLAVNARDAMPNGGTLAFVTSHPEKDVPVVNLSDHALREHYVRLSVSDTGVGMDEATRNRIFQPFFTTKKPGKGTGIGLSIVRQIVIRSGGVIDVRTVPGRGTAFDLFFPSAGNV